ncbi:hypothetical protein F4779DRAFT_630464 [Xylariaceae sp. FL0662B]|nr:hypothetical protein F4779DRAFT_630464 [Xylariaceae sp. FL0662B]
MKWVIPFTLGSLAAVGLTEVLDLGKLDQYNGKVKKPPSLNGNSVWLSGNEGDGYDVVLSPDAKAKIHGILEGCGKTDNKCYQEVREVLQSSNLEIDSQLNRRGFAQLLSKTFKKVAFVFSMITSHLISNWHVRHGEVGELGLFVPAAKASEASVFATASKILVSAQGSAVATITPTPDPTKLQGSHTPSITPVTKADNGFSKGDLAAILDKGLASRIDEVMRRLHDCDDGKKFDSEHKSKKRAGASYGQAICGAETVASMAQPGGTFNDLLLLNPNQLPFGFANPAGEVAQAANVVVDFVLAYAPMLSIEPELAQQLGTYLFALAIDALVENIPLGETNRIKSSLVTTSTATSPKPSSTKSGCPDPTASPLVCGYEDKQDCEVKLPDKTDKKDQKPVCKSGAHKGCECNAPTDMYVDIASVEEQKAMIYISKLFAKPKDPGPQLKPECQKNAPSDIPSNVFGSGKTNIYHHFCSKWSQKDQLQMTVDSAGNNRKPEIQLGKRTPPPNTSSWSHYNFNLNFQPAKGNKKCIADCSNAFSNITTTCANRGSKDIVMPKSAKLDVGCGVFDYNIVGPTMPLEPQKRKCYGKDDFGSHGDIQRYWQRLYTGYACTGTALKPIKRGDSSTFRHFQTVTNGVPYQFNIYWKDGCITDYPGRDEIYASNPQDIKDPGHVACQNLLTDNYDKCYNGGVGGSIQVGCLVYEFKAQQK